MSAVTRPDYRERRRHLEEERRAHRKAAPADCQCVDCIGPAAVHALLEAQLAAQRERTGEAPF